MDLKLELSRDHLAAEIYTDLVRDAFQVERDEIPLTDPDDLERLYEVLAQEAIAAADVFVRILQDPVRVEAEKTS